MSSLTVENYLKATLQISSRTGAACVATGQLAQALEVSPGTVTSMLKSLAESGLVEYRPYEGVLLTESGRKEALKMLRRHRLLELFLVHTLQLTWDQVHEEAEHMEHAVSDFLVDRIDDFLGHPETDPHGDPIPAANGEMRGRERVIVPLSDVPVGQQVRIVRVTNQLSEFLRFLSETGLIPGTLVQIERRSEEAGILTIQFYAANTAGPTPVPGSPPAQTTTLSLSAAGQMLVEAV